MCAFQPIRRDRGLTGESAAGLTFELVFNLGRVQDVHADRGLSHSTAATIGESACLRPAKIVRKALKCVSHHCPEKSQRPRAILAI
jgi:hypothetical protein